MNIDSAWDFNQPQVSEQRFRALLDQTKSPDYEEVLTQLARAQGLQGHFDEAHRTLDDVEQRLAADRYRIRIRYALERGRVFNSSGDPARAKPLFLQAWEIAQRHGEMVLAIDAAHMVAIVEEPDAGLEWNQKALALAESSTDERARRWKGSLLNNIGWAYHDKGAYTEALTAFQEALRVRQQDGSTLDQIQIADWCIARTLRSLNRIDEALSIQQRLQAEHEAAGTSDGYVTEELRGVFVGTGCADAAKPYFARAYVELSQDSWLVRQEPARIERLRTLGDVSA
ncbi:MAG: tetratricopeptide repeat protein [Anaerolineae bacterium]